MAPETETALNIILGTIGLISTVLIALIPYFRKTYFIGPELTIELEADGGFSLNKGLSSKNDISNGFIEIDSTIYVYEVTWKINLKITNNSNIIAYYPELNFLNQQVGFTHLERLDKNIPIKENEQITLKGTYMMYEEVAGKDRTATNGLPPNFNNLKILLSYKNPDKRKFYTFFTNSKTNIKNFYKRRKPKEFN